MKPATVSIVSGLVVILLLIGLVTSCTQIARDTPVQDYEETLEPTEISDEEKEEIQSWIEENDLNRYGDPKNTFYKGGTPLFNEGTGESIDLYEYILRNHPDRPWLK